ncbi:MAG: GTP-binding protein [Candidatus Thorarchaeota archaeon]|nr:MAG: GTP-binding protein [Candidatus Thorarchaeota archaeon]
MIHNVLLIGKDQGNVVVRTRFWKIDFEDKDITDFLRGFGDLLVTQGLAPDTPIFVAEKHKVFHAEVDGEMLLLFVTDGRDEDRVIQHRVREGASRISTALRGNSMGYIRDNLDEILGELIFTRFKVSFVGSGGVGKSTLLRLLFGREPAPGGYTPTINVAVDSSETIQFGTFLVTVWDFAGQAVFQDLWSFYFSGTDVIFLVTDSSFRNVMQTKSLLRTIRKEAPAVPLFIIANKQDLPESMKAEKIKRLLGAPTFQMIATDKTRREEFIRLMLEVAAKTVGVTLPELPISEMITVRRGTENIEQPGQKAASTQSGGFEEVPYDISADITEIASTAGRKATTTHGTSTTKTTTKTEAKPETELVAEAIPEHSQILHLMLIIHQDGVPDVAYHLNYADEEIDKNTIASLISALDSFGGIDGRDSDDGTSTTNALETIEHEGNLVMIEKSKHFMMALIVSNKSEEEAQRKILNSLLLGIEQKYYNIWDSWDGNLAVFETSMFDVLAKLPIRSVSFDYIVRAREAGHPLPFNSREVGKAVVEVKSAIANNDTVGGLVRSLDIPREIITGCLQLMNQYGWIDFKVEIGPTSILMKRGQVNEETEKAYGIVVIKFVDLCNGTTTLEDVVRKLNVSLPAMKFVATKLVLDGVLEIVA